MNTKKKRFVPKKRLIYRRFLALTLAGSLLLPGLVLIQSQPVEASFIVDMASGVVGKLRYSATVAEIIISLLSGSGASITNTQWLNAINNAYGINSTIATATGTDGTLGAMYEAGLFSVDSTGHLIDNGLVDAIRNVPEYTSTGVSELFATTSTDMELGAWQVADSATNIGEAASAGIAVGTIGQLVGAVGLGVNLGIVANKVANFLGKKMAAAQPVNAPDNIMQNVPVGYTGAYSRRYESRQNRSTYQFAPVGKGIFTFNTSNKETNWYNLSSTTQSVRRANFANNSWSWTSPNIGSKQSSYGYGSSGFIEQQGYIPFSNQAEIDSFVSSNSSTPEQYMPRSPDVVGPAGNQKPSDYQNPTNITSWPNLKPNENLEQDDTGIQPIEWDDYMDQVQIFNQNTTNNNTTIQQGDTYNNFITQYITTPQEIPSDTTVESPDYNPTVPEQPTPNPKEELTSEESQENTDYMTTPGLQDVFPFSIPWDIAGLFNVFSSNNREAPVITFPIKSALFGIDEEITLDFSVYEDVAALLRLLELIAFALGLAFVTRYLIGAGGG